MFYGNTSLLHDMLRLALWLWLAKALALSPKLPDRERLKLWLRDCDKLIEADNDLL